MDQQVLVCGHSQCTTSTKQRNRFALMRLSMTKLHDAIQYKPGGKTSPCGVAGGSLKSTRYPTRSDRMNPLPPPHVYIRRYADDFHCQWRTRTTYSHFQFILLLKRAVWTFKLFLCFIGITHHYPLVPLWPLYWPVGRCSGLLWPFPRGPKCAPSDHNWSSQSDRPLPRRPATLACPGGAAS